MKRLVVVCALLFLPEFAVGQDGKGSLVVETDGSCTTTVELIRCKGVRCGNGKNVWWDITNKRDLSAVVALVAFKHVDTGWYIDPMVGPGGNGIHAIEVGKGATKTLKMKVRKMEYFLGEYDYKVAVRFEGEQGFTICLDPKIDIGR